MKFPEISLGIGILGVPERRVRVAALIRELDVPGSSVAWDHDHEGHVPNWWRAIAIASASRPSHVLILEDDAEPCPDFLPAVHRLTALYPDRIISFYSAGRTKMASPPPRIRLEPHYRVLSDVAVVYPLEWLLALREDFEAHEQWLLQTSWQAGYGADEMRLKLRPRQQVWNTVPSLVQHGCPYQSTLGHQLPHRVADTFVGKARSALLLDWSGV